VTDPFDVLRRPPAGDEPDDRFVERVMSEVAKRLDSPVQQEAIPIRAKSDFLEVIPMHAPTHQSRRIMATVAGAAAAVALFVIVAFVATHDSTPSQTATTPPTSGPRVETTLGGSSPRELVGRWMGGTRSFLPNGGGVSLLFSDAGLELSASNLNHQPSLAGSIRSASDGVFVVSNQAKSTTGITCPATTHDGTYRWKLSASRRELDISVDSDGCSERSAALVGTYWHMGCVDTNTNCLGVLDAGSYASQYIRPMQTSTRGWTPFFGGLRYTVPDGWANFSDFPDGFGIGPAKDFAATTASHATPTHSITVFSPVAPIAGACETPKPVLSTSLEAAVAALSATPGITVSAPTPMTVDGHRALAVDVARGTAPCSNGSTNLLLVGDLTDATSTLGLDPNEKARVILVDLHHGATGENGIQLASIWIDAVNGDGLDTFIPEAMKIIETMHFS
jgi:hypothetical protein